MTYAYGQDDRLPVDRLLRRENHHPLGVRRNEATKIATEEAAEAASSNKRWTFGAAAGALLVAGTFAAGALGLSGGATPVAGSVPEHAPASPGHNPGGSAPVVGAPAPGKDDTAQKPRDDQRNQPTTPAAAGGPEASAPVGSDTSGGQTGGSQGSDGTAGGTSVVEQPAPSTQQPAPSTQQTPPPAQQPAPEQPPQSGGGVGDVLKPVTDTVGDVLSPVTDTVGGILSPLSASSTAATTSAPAPSGPALTMINPLGDLLGV